MHNVPNLFNSALEVGLRSLIILEKFTPNSVDLERLVFLDYLLLHSEDVEGGPKSIHPAAPYRSNQVLIRHKIIKEGLHLMISRQLVDVHFNQNGIEYSASKLAKPFIEYFDSSYFVLLNNIARWLATHFENTSNQELSDFINNNLEIWGSEFLKESKLKSEVYDQ